MSDPYNASQFIDSSQLEETLKIEDGFRDEVESGIKRVDTNVMGRENSGSIQTEENGFFKGLIIMLPLAILFWVMFGWLI